MPPNLRLLSYTMIRHWHIDWPIADSQLVMSEKDKQAGAFREAEYFE